MAALHDITELIDKKGTFGLNISDKFPFPNLFVGDNTLVTRSDSDEQILIHVTFNEAVCLQAIKLVAAASKPDEAPKTVKLFANRVSVSFDDMGAAAPTQVLELTANDVKAETAPTPLKQVLFSRVNSVSIFIESNQDEQDLTSIGKLRFFGKPLGSTNVSQIKKVGEDHD
jgi:hypothetical protein